MLFSSKIEPRCLYCKFGADLGDGDVACSKRGIMDRNDSCGSFAYEPTKRDPDADYSLVHRTRNT